MLPNMELSGASRKWRLLGVKRFYFPVLELVTEEDIEKKKNSKNPKKLQRKRFHQGEQKRDDTRFILTTNKYDEFSLWKNLLLCVLQLSHARCDRFHGSNFEINEISF